jgi:hypothetical protein
MSPIHPVYFGPSYFLKIPFITPASTPKFSNFILYWISHQKTVCSSLTSTVFKIQFPPLNFVSKYIKNVTWRNGDTHQTLFLPHNSHRRLKAEWGPISIGNCSVHVLTRHQNQTVAQCCDSVLYCISPPVRRKFRLPDNRSEWQQTFVEKWETDRLAHPRKLLGLNFKAGEWQFVALRESDSRRVAVCSVVRDRQ